MAERETVKDDATEWHNLDIVSRIATVAVILLFLAGCVYLALLLVGPKLD
jgi:hypothetical protein